MNDFHFELNRSGVRKLLKSKEMQNGLSSVAFAAQSRLGDGYTASYYTTDTRAVAEISADSLSARKENAETNSILKALK